MWVSERKVSIRIRSLSSADSASLTKKGLITLGNFGSLRSKDAGTTLWILNEDCLIVKPQNTNTHYAMPSLRGPQRCSQSNNKPQTENFTRPKRVQAQLFSVVMECFERTQSFRESLSCLWKIFEFSSNIVRVFIEYCSNLLRNKFEHGLWFESFSRLVLNSFEIR